MITGARSLVTLDLARHLHRYGHTVIVADPQRIHFSLFSNAVNKSYTIPSPTFRQEAFISRLIEIVEKEKIDFVIPIFEEVIPLAKAKERFPFHCEIFCSEFTTLNHLHNKWLFQERLKKWQIPIAKTELILSLKDLQNLKVDQPTILKPCYSRGSLKILRLNPGDKAPDINISAENPLIAQKWIHGTKYCSYSICRGGKVTAHAVYPFLFEEDNYCLRFEAIDHPKIYEWICNFVKLENFTGHIAFDFIEDENELYAIECNPRATFGFNLFEPEDEIHRAFFEDISTPILPQKEKAKQVAAGMLFYAWRTTQVRRNFRLFLKKVFSAKDITFSSQDLKPFLFQPIIFFTYLYRMIRWRKGLFDLYFFDIEWNGDFPKQPEEALLELAHVAHFDMRDEREQWSSAVEMSSEISSFQNSES